MINFWTKYIASRSILTNIGETLIFRDRFGVTAKVTHEKVYVKDSNQQYTYNFNQVINPLNPTETGMPFISRLLNTYQSNLYFNFVCHKNRLEIWPDIQASGRDDDWRKLGNDEVKRYVDAGMPHPHDLKEYSGKSKANVYINKTTNELGTAVENGPVDPSGYNRSHFFKTIAMNQPHFEQTLQQVDLTGYHAAQNPENAVAPIDAAANSIGGVGNAVGEIEGIWESLDGIVDNNYSIYFPEPEGGFSFTNDEFQQVVRELAYGIYRFGEIPFVSIHSINEPHATINSPHYHSVIHPVYENTLLGFVLTILDYHLKCIWSGSYVPPNIMEKLLVGQLHFSEAQSHVQDLKKYLLENHLDIEFKSEGDLFVENGLNYDFEKCGSSVSSQNVEVKSVKTKYIQKNAWRIQRSMRIIAKQNSIQRSGNHFIASPDFDVLYSTHETPEVKKLIEDHQKQTGKKPWSWVAYNDICKIQAMQARKILPKLPFLKKYFELLGVINFFCHFFATMKSHNIVPNFQNTFQPTPARVPQYLPVYYAKCDTTSKWGGCGLKTESYITVKSELVNSLAIVNRKDHVEGPLEAVWLCEAPNGTRYARFGLAMKMVIDVKVEADRWQIIPEAILNSEFELSCSEHLVFTGVVTGDSERALEGIRRGDVRQDYPLANGQTLLHLAYLYRQSEVAIALLTAGFSPIKKDRSGNGPFLLAVQFGTVQDVMFLLERYNYEVQKTGENKYGENAFHIAARRGDESIMAALIANKQKPPVRISDHIIRVICDIRNPNILSSSDHSPLITAIHHKQTAMALALLTLNDVNVNYALNSGATALHLAVQLELTEVVKKLLEKKAEITQDRNGYTALHYAAEINNQSTGLEICEALCIYCLSQRYRYCLDSTSGMLVVIPEQPKKTTSNPLGLYPLQQVYCNPLGSTLSEPTSTTETFSQEDENSLNLMRSTLAVMKILRDSSNPPEEDSEEYITSIISSLENKKKRSESNNASTSSCGMSRQIDFEPFLLDISRQNHVQVTSTSQPVPSSVNLFEVKTKTGETPLHLAVQRNNIPQIGTLLEYGCSPDTPNQSYITPIMCALIQGESDTFNTLFDYSKLTGTTDQGDTVIDLMLQYGQISLALEDRVRPYLLRNATAPDRHGFTPGHYMLIHGHISDWIDWQAQIPEALSVTTRHGLGLYESLIMLGKSASPSNSLIGPYPREPLRMIRFGWCAIHYITAYGHWNMLREYLRHGIDATPDCPVPSHHDKGKTLAYIAAEYGQMKCLKMILDEFNGSLKSQYRGNRHILYAAVLNGDHKIIECVLLHMLEAKQDINDPLDNELTRVAHVAVYLDDAELLEYLLKRGTRFDIPDRQGLLPYYHALKAKKKNAEKFFISNTRNNCLPGNAWVPAILGGNTKMIAHLIRNGLDVHEIDPETGHSPFTLAIEHRHNDILQLLTQSGASVGISNGNRETVLDVCLHVGHYEFLVNYIKTQILKLNTILSAIQIGIKAGSVDCVKILFLSLSEENQKHYRYQFLEQAEDQPDMILMLQDPNQWEVEKRRFVELIQNNDNSFKKPEEMMDVFEKLNTLFKPDRLYYFDHSALNQFRSSMSPFHLACCLNQLNLCLEMVNRYGIANSTDFNGQTIAHRIALQSESIYHQSLWGLLDWGIQDRFGKSALRHAVDADCKDVLTYLFISGGVRESLPEIIDSDGNTLLHAAVETRKVSFVRRLLTNGINPNIKNSKDQTPILIAAKNGDREIVSMLVDHGANILDRDPETGNTVLLCALENGHGDTANAILMFYSVMLSNKKGQNALHLAAKAGLYSTVNMLVKVRKQTYFLNVRDHIGYLPVHYAIEAGHVKCADVLAFYDRSFLKESVQDSEDEPLQFNNPPGVLAGISGNIEMIEYMDDCQLSDQVNDKNLGPWFFAVLCGRVNLFQYYWKWFVVKTFDHACSVAAAAAMKDQFKIMDTLINDGYPVGKMTFENTPIIFFAVKTGSSRVVARLLQAGDIIFTQNGKHAIHEAIINGHFSCVRLLVAHNRDLIDLPTPSQETPLHLACIYDRWIIAALLIKLGAALNTEDFQGKTALHHAVEHLSIPAISLLLVMGAKTDLEDGNGRPPLALLQPTDSLYESISIMFLKIHNLGTNSTAYDRALAIERPDLLVYAETPGNDYLDRFNDGKDDITMKLKRESKPSGEQHMRGAQDGEKVPPLLPSWPETIKPPHKMKKISKSQVWHVGQNVASGSGSHTRDPELQQGKEQSERQFPQQPIISTSDAHDSQRTQSSNANTNKTTAPAVADQANNGFISLGGGCSIGDPVRHIQRSTEEIPRQSTQPSGESISSTSGIRNAQEELLNTLTQFQLALQSNNSERAREFIDNGMDLTVHDNHGFAAIHLVVAYDQLVLLKLLIEKGVNPEMRSRDGYTALDYVIFHKRQACAEYLIKELKIDTYKILSTILDNNDADALRFLMKFSVPSGHIKQFFQELPENEIQNIERRCGSATLVTVDNTVFRKIHAVEELKNQNKVLLIRRDQSITIQCTQTLSARLVPPVLIPYLAQEISCRGSGPRLRLMEDRYFVLIPQA